MRVIIIGGVAGGATAAARIRRLDEKAEIIIFEKSGYISYANCGLPYYIGGVIEDKEELTLQTPESFWERFNIDVRVQNEALEINPENKTVTVKNIKTGEVYTESYDKLLISTGAKPTRPQMQGIDLDNVFTLRTVEDTYNIKDFVDECKPKSAVVVGGGFIGLEVAENLNEMGVDVTILQRPDHLLNTLDYDMATLVHSRFRKNGVKLKFGVSVQGFEKAERGVDVLIKGEEPINADMVLLAIGVTPDSTLAKNAGLDLGIKDSIVVNDRMETSARNIYAVGDAVQVKHSITGDNAVISLAGPANKQGRIAADNICGGDSRYKGSMGSSVIKIFDMTVASTGLTEKLAKASEIDYDKIVLSPMSHAGYYPGGKVMTMKVVFEKSTQRIIGAQIVGFDGVDKRIDVLATAMNFGATASDLKDLDLAYAPPYSSAKDPVNMAGFVIENIGAGKMKQFHWDDISRLQNVNGITLLDTRTSFEYSRGHIDGFINIPVDELRSRMDEIDKSKPLYVMCQSGLRSYISCRILAQNGFDCYNFSGGYRFYESVIKEKLISEKSYPCGMDK
jgi:CoA-disulfide reductase